MMENNIDDQGRQVGKRAEEVVQWYFRLNGFFLIPGFIVHPDAPRLKPRTEVDLLCLRLKDSNEGVWRGKNSGNFRSDAPTAMTDDSILVRSGLVGTVKKHLVGMVEVKAGECHINGAWSKQERSNDSGRNNMERALARVGFGNRAEIERAANAMYSDLRYEGNDFVVQYFAIGKTISLHLPQEHPKLIQVTFDQIANFFRLRFMGFPEKIPQDKTISLWDGFGNSFRWWFESNGGLRAPAEQACQAAVRRYIETGRCQGH